MSSSKKIKIAKSTTPVFTRKVIVNNYARVWKMFLNITFFLTGRWWFVKPVRKHLAIIIYTIIYSSKWIIH